jgi:hypothetical protein
MTQSARTSQPAETATPVATENDTKAVPPLVNDPAQMTLDWFKLALGSQTNIDVAALSDVVLEPIEGGLASKMVRARFSYNRQTDSPQSVVVKYPTNNPSALGMAAAMNMYVLECRFYREIAPLVPKLSVPRSYLVSLDESGKNFNLVLEDVAVRAQPGDVLRASSVDECTSALAQLVELQAPLWNSLALFDSVPQGIEPFLERFGHGLEPEHIKLIESVVPHAGNWARGWSAPMVLQHGDFRSDNLMFSTIDTVPRATVIDFQVIRLGPPGVDAAYFVGSSLPTKARRAFERELIREYHSRLQSAGVGGYDFDACWNSYRDGAMYGVFLFVAIASRVEPTERGDRVIIDQFRRYADMAVDLESAEVSGLF